MRGFLKMSPLPPFPLSNAEERSVTAIIPLEDRGSISHELTHPCHRKREICREREDALGDRFRRLVRAVKVSFRCS